MNQVLCLFRSELSEQGKVHNIAAALMQMPEGLPENDPKRSLSYAVSLEKIFDSGIYENLCIKICALCRGSHQMDQFEWRPLGAPNPSAISRHTQVIYLTKKASSTLAYCQVLDFDILNTEVRA